MKIGDTLTISGTIIGQSGEILFQDNDVVTVRDFMTTRASWFYGTYIPQKIIGIKINEYSGIWNLSAFKETNNPTH